MAATYTVFQQYPDTEYISATATRPVVAVGYITVPHGVYFESRIPQSAYTTEEVDNTGKVNSEPLENLFNIKNVTDVEWGQVGAPSGYIKDQITTYYQSTSGNSSGSVTVPFTGISVAEVEALVEAGVALLDTAEAL